MNVKYIPFTFNFICNKCNTETLINSSFAENLIMPGLSPIKDQYCPSCGEQVVTPKGDNKIRNGKLISVYE